MSTGTSTALLRRCFTALALVASTSLLGCGGSGPQLALVTGTVIMDGIPVSEALVEFVPEDGRPSFGTTDELGQFSLQYTEDQPGAIVGKHHVKITTVQVSGEVPEGTPPPKKEEIPAKYNTETTLQADVNRGTNNVDFELRSL